MFANNNAPKNKTARKVVKTKAIGANTPSGGTKKKIVTHIIQRNAVIIAAAKKFFRRSNFSCVAMIQSWYHMPSEFLLLLGAIIVGYIIILWFINRKLTNLGQNKPSDDLVEWLKSTNSRLEENSRAFNQRLDSATQVIAGVQRSVGEMSEIGRSMRELQEFLRSPKLRGNIGEQVLKELLGQMLPKQSFHLQYAFKSGNIVDAAVITSAGIISIDSKFPMESFGKMTKAQNDTDRKLYEREFARDIKRHIDDISRKYILTDEGTIDYALMYVPSESVYYELINTDGIADYAHDHRVLAVSPTTFYAYMKAILMSFEGQKIEEQAKQILSAIKSIEKDYGRVEENLSILGKHLNNAFNMMGNVNSSFNSLGQKISSTNRLGTITKEEVKKLTLSD